MIVWVESLGSFAAVCTTLCWAPQTVKIVREKRTEGISLVTQSVFTVGVALWFIYGLLLHNRPIFLANGVTLVLSLALLILKLRYPSRSLDP
jgi:MtN3 and saliva related transmembrane protein